MEDIKHPMDEERLKLIFEIMALAVLVQDQTEYCVFIDYSGHVDNISISIRESKERWGYEACASEFKVILDEYYHTEPKTLHAYLKAKRDILKSILENHEIPFGFMDQEIEKVIHYRF